MSLAAFIDHTLLKQTATTADIEKLCNEAQTHGFAAVCVPPVYVRQAANQLMNTAVKVATVIGFPFGYTYPDVKAKEAADAITNGVQELDMVMNITAFKNGDMVLLRNEIESLLAVTQGKPVVVKVIIESGLLSDDEIIRCCDLYATYPIHFLKTSTGYAERCATVEAVQLMRRHLPSDIDIKASGGIKTYAFARQLVEAGATRLGTSSGVAIVTGEPVGSGNY